MIISKQKKSLFINLLLSLGILSVSFFAIESYLRFKEYYYTWSENNGQGYAWVHKDHFSCGTLLNVPNSLYNLTTPEFDYEVKQNNEGIRDIDHDVEKPSGEFRILALGDSYTAGRGAIYENGWVKVLESQLMQKRPDRNVSCIVGAADGFDISCSYELFTSRFRKYDPDLVLLAINNSDISELMQRDYKRKFNDQKEQRPFYQPSRYQIEKLYKKSHLVRFICKELVGFDDYLEWESEKMSIEDSYIHVEMTVSKFIQMGREDDFKTVIVSHPFNHEAFEKKYKPVGETACYMELLDNLDRDGAKVIDILQHYNEELDITRENQARYYWPIDYHHNAAGYFEFGRIVSEELIQMGYLDE